MYKRVEKLRRQNAAPRQTVIEGQPHMLAYINEAERQMLKRAGGAELPGPAGIPAYAYQWDSNKSFGENLMGSLKDTASSIANDISSVFGGNDNNNSNSNNNSNNNNTASAYQQLGESLNAAGVANIGGKTYPDEPANPGNPAILEYNSGNDDDGPSYTVVGALDPTKPASVATNADGSIYQPTDNPVNIANTLGTADLINTGYGGNMVLSDGNGGYITVDGNQLTAGGNWDATGGNTTGGGTGTGTGTSVSEPVNTGPTAEEIAAAEEAARKARVRKAREAKLGELANAFGFATDDYFQGLGTSYREGGLSEAFTKAYDDALRGIYDVYKSAGLLSQADVDDDLGILAGAEGGEEGRLNSIVDQYVLANQNYVSGGQSSIADQINALDTVDAINSFNINSAVAPYKEPTEQAVVDFFTDFVKREYDPSYNVDPTAVASGGPRRVSQSVDESGVSGQPSSLAGIFDPVSGNSAKVIK